MGNRATIALLAAMLLHLGTPARAQQSTAQAAPQKNAPVLLDEVVAVVNGEVLLQSELEDEVRFAAFEPFSLRPDQNARRAALDRLIDRTLVLQQMKGQPGLPVISEDQLNKQLAQLRKTLPECEKLGCTTDHDWAAFCATHGFTPEEVAQRWRTRMLLLAFIEQRFRTGIRISQAEIEQYYNSAFVPRFKERNLSAPPLSQVQARVEEILLQQRVNTLLDDWLKGLHEQGSVEILDPSLAPAEPAG